MKPLVIVFFLFFLAAVSHAGDIAEYRTADGGRWFSDRPPRASTLVRDWNEKVSVIDEGSPTSRYAARSGGEVDLSSFAAPVFPPATSPAGAPRAPAANVTYIGPTTVIVQQFGRGFEPLPDLGAPAVSGGFRFSGPTSALSSPTFSVRTGGRSW